MSNKPLILLNTILLGLLVWLLLKPETVRETASVTGQAGQPGQTAIREIEQLKRRIEALELDLSQETAARINLEKSLQNDRLTASKERWSNETSEFLPTITDIALPAGHPQIDDQASVEERIIEVGIPEDTYQAMKSIMDQRQLDMLLLRDRATREGWRNSDDYREQMSVLRNPYRDLRDDFGDDAYDQFLYVTGSPNRVQIQEVYQGSAAYDAGLQPGDIVVSYASNRIYTMTALRDSTLQGVSGESILLEFERDGSTVTTSVPRGPLGVSMTSLVVKPD